MKVVVLVQAMETPMVVLVAVAAAFAGAAAVSVPIAVASGMGGMMDGGMMGGGMMGMDCDAHGMDDEACREHMREMHEQCHRHMQESNATRSTPA